MKRTNSSLLFFYLTLLITSSLGQLSFTDPWTSNPGEYTVTQKSNGKLLTLSTTKGFSWIMADPMAAGDKVYVTLLCVSSGSVIDVGIGTHVSYRRETLQMRDDYDISPMVGGFNFVYSDYI